MTEQEIRSRTQEILEAYRALTGDMRMLSIKDFVTLRKEAINEGPSLTFTGYTAQPLQSNIPSASMDTTVKEIQVMRRPAAAQKPAPAQEMVPAEESLPWSSPEDRPEQGEGPETPRAMRDFERLRAAGDPYN